MSEAPSKFENFKQVMKDGKARTVWIVGLVLMTVCGIFAYLSISQKRSAQSAMPTSEVLAVPNMRGMRADTPTPQATPVYDKLLQEQNEREAEIAKTEGSSSIPVIRSSTEKTPEPQSQAPVQQPTQQQNDGRQEEERRQQLAAASALTQAMKGQAGLLITAWSPKEHASMAVAAPKEMPGSEQVGHSQPQAASAGGSVPARDPIAIKKAGDTCYAELDTAVNTDEPSPVTATIRQCGELDQSKLVGKIEVAQNAQKAVLRFTTINIPGQSSSISIDAVAMDEMTRRTALASDVDNHYLLRYGALFASAFVSGFGDALMKGGQDQQLVTTATGGIVQQQKAFDTKQLVLAGVGNVGKQAGANMGNVFNRPPTIKIDAGLGIGILFMTDLTLK